MTYSGVKPIIRTNTAMLITDIALITANFIMFQKIANVLSIVSFLMVTSVIGGGYFGYKYVTSEQFKSRVMNQVMKEVQTILPGQIQKKLPKVTGKSLPF